MIKQRGCCEPADKSVVPARIEEATIASQISCNCLVSLQFALINFSGQLVERGARNGLSDGYLWPDRHRANARAERGSVSDRRLREVGHHPSDKLQEKSATNRGSSTAEARFHEESIAFQLEGRR